MATDIEDRARRDAANEQDDEDDTLPTETTTLLNSETSSGTLRDGSPSGSGTRDSDATSHAPEQPSVSKVRAGCIMFSLWILIFLQGTYLPTPKS